MDYLKILQKAESKDASAAFILILKDCIESGSTGGEIISCIGSHLNDNKKGLTRDYCLLKNEINQYLHDCVVNGFFFH